MQRGHLITLTQLCDKLCCRLCKLLCQNSISGGKRFNFSAKYPIVLNPRLGFADGGRDRAHGGDDFAAEGHSLGEAAAAEGGADQTLQPTPEAQRRDVQRRAGAQARTRPRPRPEYTKPFLSDLFRFRSVASSIATREISLTSFSSQIF